MNNIKVKHSIGDVIEHSFNGNKYKVIGYNYIEGTGIKYICLQADKEDYVYLSDIEIISSKDSFIGFNKKGD